jgi:hypothetical protein
MLYAVTLSGSVELRVMLIAPLSVQSLPDESGIFVSQLAVYVVPTKCPRSKSAVLSLV